MHTLVGFLFMGIAHEFYPSRRKALLDNSKRLTIATATKSKPILCYYIPIIGI
jgi:hypothetical protein